MGRLVTLTALAIVTMRQGLWRLGFVVVILAVLLAPAQQADASYATVSGTIYKGQRVWFTSAREVTVGGSNIYHQKTDGPGMWLAWYKCSDRTVRGSDVYFHDADPTSRLMLDYGFRNGAVFCLTAVSNGVFNQDTFTGGLEWNVFS